MAANPKCRVEIMHSARSLQVLTMSWSDFAWRMFGGNSQILKPIYESLKSTKVATYKDDRETVSKIKRALYSPNKCGSLTQKFIDGIQRIAKQKKD